MFHYLKNNILFLKLHVQPNAKYNKIIGLHADRLKIQIKSVPVDDKANNELIAFLSTLYDIKRNRIKIASGKNQRDKLIAINEIEQKEIDYIKLISEQKS